VLDAAAGAGARTVVHCCAEDVPVALLRTAGADAISLDAAYLSSGSLDEELGAALESGVGLLLGLVPTSGSGGMSDLAGTVAPARALWRRLALAPELLARTVVVTPACGLAGATPAVARAALVRCREAARDLVDDPEG
jgi:hypothetical protein